MADGTESAPGLAFTNDTDTGFTREAANTLTIAASGRSVARFTGVGTSAVNEVNITNANTGGAPTIFARSDNDANVALTISSKGTGTMLVQTEGAGNVDIDTDGTNRMRISSAGIALNNHRISSLSVGSAASPSINFGGDADTGPFRSAADTYDISTGGTSRLSISTTLISAGTNIPFVPGAVSGTPAQHGLFRENVTKAWCRADAAGNISDSFNVSSITDNGTGDLTVTWDRDFANATYVSTVTAQSDAARIATISNTNPPLTTAARYLLWDAAGVAADPDFWNVHAIGDQ